MRLLKSGQQEDRLNDFAFGLGVAGLNGFFYDLVYFWKGEKRDHFNELFEFLHQQILMLTIFSEHFDDGEQIFFLVGYLKQISDQPDEYFHDVLFGFFAELLNYLFKVHAAGFQINCFHNVVQSRKSFLSNLGFTKNTKHVDNELQHRIHTLAVIHEVRNFDEAPKQFNSHFSVLLHKSFNEKRHEFFFHLLGSQGQSDCLNFLDCLLFDSFVFEFFGQNGDGVEEGQFSNDQRIFLSFHFNFCIYNIQMNQSQPSEEQHLKILAIRIKHPHWQVRKRAYEDMQTNLQAVSSLKEEFKINSEVFTPLKLTAMLNNLTEEKHPILVLKGLDCVNSIIEIDKSSTKYFNQLISEGLEKFPQLTQQRKQVLQKFMTILEHFREDSTIPATLNSKLSLLNQKAVMWVIQVIGALDLVSLKKKLQELSRKHPKKDVRQLAGEIAGELGDEGSGKKIVEEIHARSVVRRKEEKTVPQKEESKQITQLVQKLHTYEQMKVKEQQNFTSDLLEAAQLIAELSTPQLSNLSYLIQLMIEDNNQIISMNGVKILTVLVKARSQLIPGSYPLLFLFRKFKMHKTHATNFNLFKLIDVLVCSNRSNDLMSAILEGMNLGENKANVKYGCQMSFLRIFCYFYQLPDLFQQYCIGEFQDFNSQIENRKSVEKTLSKCAELFLREKDRDLIQAMEVVREVMGIPSVAASARQNNKETVSEAKSVSRNKGKVVQQPKPQALAKSTVNSKTMKSSTSTPILSPEGELNKILELVVSEKSNESLIHKAIDKCLKCVSSCVEDQIYDMFYFCQILQAFIEDYQPDERWDQPISVFLIDYLKIVAGVQIKSAKRSKLVENGITYLFKIAITKLTLGKELVFVLNLVNEKVGTEVILKCLENVLVTEGELVRKKNKKYLSRWLQGNIPQELITNQYFEIREAIETKKEKKKDVVEGPPSVMSIPKEVPNYRDIKAKPNTSVQHSPFEAEIDDVEQTEKKVINLEQKEDCSARKERKVQRLQMFQNADISKIEQREEGDTDRLDERWEYFLNKKGVAGNQGQSEVTGTPAETKSDHYSEEQKFDFGQQHQKGTKKEGLKDESQQYIYQYEQKEEQVVEKKQQREVQGQQRLFNLQESGDKKQLSESSIKGPSSIKGSDSSEEHQSDDELKEKPLSKDVKFKYMFLDDQRITYMLLNSGKSFNHLRTLVILPFKKETNKQGFLSELTHLLQHLEIGKPEPFKSLLLLVITLFSQIRNDKSIIEPLQFLYEFMAQKCSNNQFLKIIIGLYHCVIEEAEEGDRKLLLTILAKSMIRIMPYVQNSLQLLKDFQQFYQIGELVYFQMYPEEYHQIREVLEASDSLEEIIAKACEQEGEGILAIVEGWLDTAFKVLVREHIEALLVQVQDTDDS